MTAVVQEMVVARPDGPLRTVVAQHHGYRERGGAPGRHLGLPSPWLTLIFTLDEPLRMARHPDARQAPGPFVNLVGGLHTTPAVIAHDGTQAGVQLQLSPLGARALFGLPGGALHEVDVHATDLLGPAADDLQEQLQAAPGWAARFAVLDQTLGARLDPARRPAPEITEAWRLLLRSGGTIRIADLARHVGWGERHLARRLRVETGYTPKTAARVIRFDRARRLLPRSTGADVAARCGYADQAHLVRDFAAFAGCSPTAWLAAEVGNLQAPAPDETAA